MASDSPSPSPVVFIMGHSIPYTYTHLHHLSFPPYPPTLQIEPLHCFFTHSYTQKTHSHKASVKFSSFSRDLKGNREGAHYGLHAVSHLTGFLPPFFPSLTSKAKHRLYCVHSKSGSNSKCGFSGLLAALCTQS